MSRQIVISKEEMVKAGFTVVKRKTRCPDNTQRTGWYEAESSMYSRNSVTLFSSHGYEFIADCKEGGINEALFIKEGLFKLKHQIQ